MLLGALAVMLVSCGPHGNSSENPEINDSLSRARQKAHNDSLKAHNPLLILPPDSNYTGDYVDRYTNGIVKFKGQFRFGERHGQWVSFFPTGKTWSEMQYDKGSREGQNIVYYENGDKRYEGFYKNDMQDSLWTYYDSIGKVVTKVLYSKDRIVKKLQ